MSKSSSVSVCLLEPSSRSIARKASSFANGACELYEMLIIEEREM